MIPNSYGCYFMVPKAMCELPQGLHDSLSVCSFFQIKASDEEACSIITGNATATLCEIHVTKETSKLNMSQRGVNIPLLYECNLIWCVCHNALPVREEIIHQDWIGWRAKESKPHCVALSYHQSENGKDIQLQHELSLLTLIIPLPSHSEW